MRVSVLGATASIGPYVIRHLQAAGYDVVAVGRNPDRLAEMAGAVETAPFELENLDSIRQAVDDADAVVSLVHARHAAEILALLPRSCRRVVLTGSTRCLTRFPDASADAVRAAEAAVVRSDLPATILHPTMIYGTGRDRNVGRILRLLGHWPSALPIVLPLPKGGENMVQPILVDDLAAAMCAAVGPARLPHSMVLGGPDPMSYAEMVRACGAAIGRRVRIVPVSAATCLGAAGLLRRGRFLPPQAEAMVRRFLEDRCVDITPAKAALGFDPIPFAEGLRVSLGRVAR